jgi:Rrf2 family protein
MLSMKTRYAMIALTKLAEEYGKGAMLINNIALSEKIPQRFLENILLELKKLGILGSKLGRSGGYFLLKKPEDINLADIIGHFEDSIGMLYCVSEKAYQPCEFCRNEDECKIRPVFKDIRDYTHNALQKTSFADLIKLPEIQL